MGVSLTIDQDLKGFDRFLKNNKKQLPFASSVALNSTGFDIRQALNKGTQGAFGKPTKFTQKAFLTTKSKKTNLVVHVFAKDKEGYGNARIAYKNYLDTLNSLKTGYQRFSGAKVSTGMMSPRMAGRVQSIGRATTFEDKLGEWNSRMRKFAVARYYASLGKK